MVRTLVISSPCRLSVRYEQLVIQPMGGQEATRPMIDIGYLIVEHPQVSYTHAVLVLAAKCNTALIVCDERHLPCSLMLPFEGHHLPGRRFQEQLSASEPLKKTYGSKS